MKATAAQNNSTHASVATKNSNYRGATYIFDKAIGGIVYASFIIAGAIVFVGSKVEGFIGLDENRSDDQEWTVIRQ
ncbi:Aa_trans domain-containing protein [Caenorhabditis elegans]|uniref:Aa_trans domain-containing protein n=1 Tax=Caenorhabditis elegans TaxID=6239 RepID=A0A061AL07_CAEEL|nr:Aa_trans domain-containing protein [Caenorhabditis elegans]CDR32757.1 Aa_trans domain-containing protein [Caenorhabditis elegans]|eukprot:NP_001293295.1 Uncharacterized protein CELE_C03D6.9 [Caenorhabditis elegans]